MGREIGIERGGERGGEGERERDWVRERGEREREGGEVEKEREIGRERRSENTHPFQPQMVCMFEIPMDKHSEEAGI